MPVVATLCFVVSYVTETLTQCSVVVVAKLATLSRAQLCIRVQLNIIWPLGYKVWGVGVGVDQELRCQHADRRHRFAGLVDAAGDRAADMAGDLLVDRDVAGGVDPHGTDQVYRSTSTLYMRAPSRVAARFSNSANVHAPCVSGGREGPPAFILGEGRLAIAAVHRCHDRIDRVRAHDRRIGTHPEQVAWCAA